MTLNALMQPHRDNINTLINKLGSKFLYVDETFQRRLVWTEKQKIRLIETILIGYPMPEIYLWDQKPDPTTGEQRQSIVDGQQRLRAIHSYRLGEFKLKKQALDNRNRDRSFSGKEWSQLSLADQHSFLEYKINIRTIPSDTSDGEIRTVFTRINETDRSLNPQEMRHAELQGAFLNASEEVANFDSWKKIALFSQNDSRRMKDVQYASSLLTYLRNGVVSDTASSLNEMYNLYSDSYPRKYTDINLTKEILLHLSEIHEASEVAKEYISKETHLYVLFVVEHIRRAQKSTSITAQEVETFFSAYEKFDPDAPVPPDSAGARKSELLRKYRQGSSYRTGSKGSRELRVFSFQDYLADTKKQA